MTALDSSVQTGRLAGDERFAGHPLAARPLCLRPLCGLRHSSNPASELRRTVHALNTKWLNRSRSPPAYQTCCFQKAQALVATLNGLFG